METLDLLRVYALDRLKDPHAYGTTRAAIGPLHMAGYPLTWVIYRDAAVIPWAARLSALDGIVLPVQFHAAGVLDAARGVHAWGTYFLVGGGTAYECSSVEVFTDAFLLPSLTEGFRDDAKVGDPAVNPLASADVRGSDLAAVRTETLFSEGLCALISHEYPTVDRTEVRRAVESIPAHSRARGPVPDAEFRLVAATYNSAPSEPTKAVETTLGYNSRSTTEKRIREARARGYITRPAPRGGRPSTKKKER